jgi:D-serine deaminase-like pyridoxal phosphate-dependent protein
MRRAPCTIRCGIRDNEQVDLPGDIDTPALIVDSRRLERNIAAMAAAAAAAGVALRPHAKTHKCPQIARMQLAHGAAGLTVATISEAELFADAGCQSVFIAYPVWAGGGRRGRIAALHERTDLRVGVDSVRAAEELARAARGLRVLIEVDSGQHRTGVPAHEAADLAVSCLRLGLEVTGAFTHPGQAYVAPDAAAGAAADERRELAEAGAALRRVTGREPELSGGSTPTACAGVTAPLTEVRPGTYAFYDRQQMRLSRVTPADVALTVAARVVSVPRPNEAVLDCGSKTLSSDRPAWLDGHGLLLDAPEAAIAVLSEEHAVVTGLRTQLAVGDLVGVIPNHVCTTVNLARELVIVDGGSVMDRWPVRTARQ